MEQNKPQPLDEPLLTIDQAAVIVGVSTRTLSSWIRDGLIPSKSIGRGTRRFVRAELEAWIKNSNSTAAKARGNTGSVE
jgi:excisionase family DNA binding protein